MKRCGCLLLLLIACGTAYCQPGWPVGMPQPLSLVAQCVLYWDYMTEKHGEPPSRSPSPTIFTRREINWEGQSTGTVVCNDGTSHDLDAYTEFDGIKSACKDAGGIKSFGGFKARIPISGLSNIQLVPEPADVPAIPEEGAVLCGTRKQYLCMNGFPVSDDHWICTDKQRFLLQRSDGEWRCVKF